MADEDTRMDEFGAELRRLRIAAGLSLAELGKRIYFSKGFISKVETGWKSPGPHFARKADVELNAEGRLMALAEGQEGDPVDAAGSPEPSSRVREVVFVRRADTTVDEAEAKDALNAFELNLANLRGLGQILDPSTVADMLKPQVHALQELAARLDDVLADKTLLLAAHFADFTSWMTQETGDDAAALRWIDTSEALAIEANNIDVVANSYIRRANIALYQQDAYGTVTFARQAQAMECSLRVKGLAAQGEAQGHALAGDYEKFSACIDRALVQRAASGEEQPAGPVLGPTKIRDPLALARGWSLFDLGRITEAVEILAELLADTPKKDNRAWVRIACRLALALASGGEVDRACVLAKDVLDLSTVARSATIRSDLRQLSRMLSRWSTKPAVQEVLPRMSAILLRSGRSRWSSTIGAGERRR
jgi:transcriptional regulator with XRE-family HTH domain